MGGLLLFVVLESGWVIVMMVNMILVMIFGGNGICYYSEYWIIVKFF